MQHNNISVPNPCPMLSSRMPESDKGFHCKSCKTEVIDFTQLSDDQIKDAFMNGAKCGIFTEEQVGNSLKKRTLAYSFLFKLLVFLSFLGFSVNPISAQNTKTEESIEIEKPKHYKEKRVYLKDRKKEMKKLKKTKKSKLRRKRHVRGKLVTGCPAF